jgi:hypothetical protein
MILHHNVRHAELVSASPGESKKAHQEILK